MLTAPDFLPAIEVAQRAGKIRWYGVSCRTVEDAALCLALPGITAVQIELNRLQMQAADSLIPEASRRKVAVIAREPLASGALVAKCESRGRSGGCEDQADAVQSALQAVLNVVGVTVAIVGMSSREHLRENIRAAEDVRRPPRVRPAHPQGSGYNPLPTFTAQE